MPWVVVNIYLLNMTNRKLLTKVKEVFLKGFGKEVGYQLLLCSCTAPCKCIFSHSSYSTVTELTFSLHKFYIFVVLSVVFKLLKISVKTDKSLNYKKKPYYVASCDRKTMTDYL